MFWTKLQFIFIRVNFGNEHTMFTYLQKLENIPLQTGHFKNLPTFPKKDEETMEDILNFNLSILKQSLTIDWWPQISRAVV